MGLFDIFKKNVKSADPVNKVTGTVSSSRAIIAANQPVQGSSSIEITNMDQLQNLCIDSRNAIINAKNGETAISYALKAQLQVVNVLNSPELTESPIDIILESLNLAIQVATDEQEKAGVQQKIAVMINNMIFFMEARLYYEKKNFSKEGEYLLKEGCKMLAVTTSSLLIATGTGGGAVAINSEHIFKAVLASKDFFQKLFAFFTQKKRIEAYRKEFYGFLHSTFDKLYRNHGLFGSSIILKELVLRYKKAMVEESLKLYEYQKSPDNIKTALNQLDPDNKSLQTYNEVSLKHEIDMKKYKTFVILYVLGAVIMGTGLLFFLFNWWGGDTWLEHINSDAVFYPLFSVHFFILEIPFLIKVGSIFLVALGYYFGYTFLENKKKSIEETFKCMTQKATEDIQNAYFDIKRSEYDIYYTAIANLFGP
jgi:hypothetical protein